MASHVLRRIDNLTCAKNKLVSHCRDAHQNQEPPLYQSHIDDVIAAWKPLLASLEKAGPELIIISAGFDAHHDDPLASINMTSSDYYELTAMIISLADKTANGRVVSLLEGGYDLDALSSSLKHHLMALSGKPKDV